MANRKKTLMIVTLSAALGLGAFGWLDRNVLASAGADTGVPARGSKGGTVATAPPPSGWSNGTRIASGSYSDGTYTGSRVYAYYGYVQVRASVAGGRIHQVKVLEAPSHSGTSRYINGIAVPYLEDEAVSTQTSRVDVISGATLTSRAFVESLDSALTQAH